jgi:phospholipid/cholesterol/gamma-HCH transport system ATP-binding protein
MTTDAATDTVDEPIIRVRGLVNRFGEQVVHDGVDLDVRAGEILGVVGGSGTGKSVLMRSILGLRTPDAGEIEVLGLDALSQAPEDRLHIEQNTGVLFQDGALFSSLTVGENVQVPLKEHCRDLPDSLRYELALLKVKLAGLPADALDKLPSQLSGGMRKRAGLARALALDPPLLFLDEPTAGLDPQSRHQVWELVRRLLDHGTTIVLTTHYLEEAEQLADRLAIMHAGQIDRMGSVSEIVASEPARIRYRTTSTALANLEALATLPALTAGSRSDTTGVELATTDLQVTLNALLRRAHDADAVLIGLDASPASLEQTFLTIAQSGNDPVAVPHVTAA